jgi:hypothetical protein
MNRDDAEDKAQRLAGPIRPAVDGHVAGRAWAEAAAAPEELRGMLAHRRSYFWDDCDGSFRLTLARRTQEEAYELYDARRRARRGPRGRGHGSIGVARPGAGKREGSAGHSKHKPASGAPARPKNRFGGITCIRHSTQT